MSLKVPSNGSLNRGGGGGKGSLRRDASGRGSSRGSSRRDDEAGGGGGFNVGSLINKLRKGADSAPLKIKASDVEAVIDLARDVFLSQPVFLQIDAPVNVCGDIHGQFSDLIRIFRNIGFPPNMNYLFLGDYVDRGRHSLETILLLLCYKIMCPESFFMLRGNHECREINRTYGFFDEMNRRFDKVVKEDIGRSTEGIKLWKRFQDVFNVMPISALISGKVLCMHGGIPQHLNLNFQDWSQMEAIERPYECPPEGIVCDLLWADPDPNVDHPELNPTGAWFLPNVRGVSHIFGPTYLKIFCDSKGIDLVCRAHQVVEDGYEMFPDSAGEQRLVTLFSAPNYCGEFDNKAAILQIDANLLCSFKVLEPANKKSRRLSVKGRESTKRDE